MKRILSLMLCTAMLVGMFVTVVSAANYAIGTNTALYNASSIISTGGNCMYVTANAENGYADIKQNDSSTEMGTRTFTLSHAYCIMGATGSGTSRIAIGTSEGMVLGYDHTNKCFFISKNGELFGTTLDSSAYTYKYAYRLLEGCWYYIAFRFTATTAHIYLNGSEILAASYSEMGLTRSGWAIYYPKNINFYADNYQFFMDDARVSYSANLGGYITGTKAVVYPYAAGEGCRVAATLGEGDVDLGQVSINTPSANGVVLTEQSIGEIQFARKVANETGNTNQAVTANNDYGTFLNLVRNAISAAYNAGTAVSAAQINAADYAWGLTPADGKSVLAGEGYNHLLGKTHGYYYGATSTQAADARNKINAIGTVTYTSASKSKIDAARAAYNSLLTYTYDTGYNNDVTDGWVTNGVAESMASYATILEAAEAKYAELEEANSQAAIDQAAANAVISKINAIGTVTYNSGSAITAAESAYNGLTATQKALVTNYSTLTSARSTWNALDAEVTAYKNAVAALPATATDTQACATAIANCATAYATLTSPGQTAAVATEKAKYDTFRAAWLVAKDKTAANAVVAKINAIGTVTINSGSAIADAEAAYSALTDDQKAYVTNYSTLTTARATYNALVIDTTAANEVIAKINAIGTVNLNSEAAIVEAETAYGALTASQKALVSNYATLTAARTAYDTLVSDKAAADAVITKINAIGIVSYTNISKIMIDDARAAYNALTNDNQRNQITNYQTLLDAEAEYAALKKAADDQAAADAVIAEINAIGTVTIDSADAIAAARDSFTALTVEQQPLVTNIATLEAAEARLAELRTAKTEAEAVMAQINAIGTVTLDSKAAIEDAETAYAALSDDAETFVTNYKTLTDARSTYDALVLNTVKQFNSDATAELKDQTVANKADIQALVDLYNSTIVNLIDQLPNSAINAKSQAKSNATKLNNALAAIEAIEAASAVNKIGATSLVISDSLAINYKINVGADYEIVRMEFTLAGVTTVVTDYTTDASGKLVFKYNDIAPNLMGETISSVIVVKDNNGKEISCCAQEYSVAAYANKKIATTAYTELLASMINYGDAAVAYTDGVYTAPSSLITGWDSYSASIAPEREYTSIYEISSDIAAPAVTWGSANLILGEAASIRIKLTGEILDDYKVVAVYNGMEYTFDIYSDNGDNYFVWDLFNMAQMSNACVISFTVYDADGNAVSNSLTYSVESYVADMLQRDAKLDNLLIALMQYGDAAFAFKHANG